MTFLGLIWHNIAARRLRAALTASAVAIAVMAVIALGVLTSSLKTSATGILKVGNADFTVAQKHVDNILNSTISEDDIAKLGKVPGVQDAIGALIQLEKYDADNPAVIQVGLDPKAQGPFGVVILEGRSYKATANHEVMLGYVIAQSLHKGVGDPFRIDDHDYRVVGLYRTNISFGNSTIMFPLPELQGRYQLAGNVSLGFVKADPGVNKKQLARTIDRRFLQLATVSSESDYGKVDNTLVLISAANTGGGILAAVIAISGVLNTSLLSFFERIREFGVLRSIGWSRRRVIGLVLGEALVTSLVGAMFGVLLGWAAINVLQNLSQLKGVFHPTYEADIFGRALYFAFAVAFIGALYPALRAAFLRPIEALRRE